MSTLVIAEHDNQENKALNFGDFSSVLSGLFWALGASILKKWSKVPILSFMDAVCFGANLDSEDVCLSFRNQLGSGYLKRRGTHIAQYLLNAFIKCFNSHVQKIPTIKFIAPYPNTEMYAIVDAKKIHPIIEVIPNVPTF